MRAGPRRHKSVISEIFASDKSQKTPKASTNARHASKDEVQTPGSGSTERKTQTCGSDSFMVRGLQREVSKMHLELHAMRSRKAPH
jgi:hypothetical protein